MHKKTMRHIRIFVTVLIVILLFKVLVILLFKSYWGNPFSVCDWRLKDRDDRKPLVLVWTSFFHRDFASILDSYQKKDNCPRQCIFSSRRECANYYDAVLFHSWNLNSWDLPKYRFAHHMYIFFSQEPPRYAGNALESFDSDYFNMTMTYRLDSDVWAPYDAFEKIEPETSADDIYTWEQVEAAAGNKTASVLLLVSNCNSPSKREVYVKKLSHFIQVSEYGRCSGIPCDKKCEDREIERHRFYLAFENSVCKDYVSEKAFRVKRLIVPVVLKGSLYNGILPNGSYIAADHFETPQQLAIYLNYLSTNYSEYIKYFEWTKYYKKSEALSSTCDLCDYLYKHKNTSKTIKNIQEWWYNEGKCEDAFGAKLSNAFLQMPSVLLMSLFLLISFYSSLLYSS